VRVLVEKHLPAEYRSKFTWRQFAGLLKRAAEGQQDVAEVSTALRIVLQLARRIALNIADYFVFISRARVGVSGAVEMFLALRG